MMPDGKLNTFLNLLKNYLKNEFSPQLYLQLIILHISLYSLELIFCRKAYFHFTLFFEDSNNFLQTFSISISRARYNL